MENDRAPTWEEMLAPPGAVMTGVSVKFGVRHRPITVPVRPIVTHLDCRAMRSAAVPHHWSPQQMQLLLAIM